MTVFLIVLAAMLAGSLTGFLLVLWRAPAFIIGAMIIAGRLRSRGLWREHQ